MAGAHPLPPMLACLLVFVFPAILHLYIISTLHLDMPASLAVGILAVHPSFQPLRTCCKDEVSL